MACIADSLTQAGYAVFLPQVDGLEFANLYPILLGRGMGSEDAAKVLNMAIFSLDVFEIIDSDGLVLNVNGRVPDEGAMVEGGVAWAHGKPVVIYRSDDRSLIHGNCNPLVMGLADFESVGAYDEIPAAFNRRFAERSRDSVTHYESKFCVAKGKGRQIRECLAQQKPLAEVAELLVDLFGEIACQT
jgi:hypothetical protein